MTFNARGLYASSSKVPRRRRFGWLVLGAIVGLIALVLGMLGMLGNASTHTGTREDAFAAAAVVELDNGTPGSVTVEEAPGDEITVERDLRSSLLSEAADEVELDGDRLEIQADCEGLLPFGTCWVDYHIGVPEGVAVEIETSTGGIEMTDLRGDVRAESATGAITLRDVVGSVELESSTGEISAEGSGPSAEVRTTTGSIDIQDFAATRVEVESTTGGVLVGSGFEEAQVSTTTGTVTVRTDQEFERLVADSTTGSLELRVPDTAYRITGDSTTGERAFAVEESADAAARIEADTTTGSVTIRPY